MKRYEKYKKVDLPYLTEIPEHWSLRRNKNLFNRKKVTVGSEFNDYQLLSLTTKGLREKSINDFNGKLPESYETYQKVDIGDLIMCLFDLDCSAVFAGLSKYDGMITSAYLRLKCRKEVCPEYYNYWFSYLFQNRVYKIYSKSIRFTISNSDFGLIEGVYPPVKEQEKIAAFLDYKISRIDKAIELEEKKKDEIKKLKDSFTVKCVTKGLDSNALFVDSGIEWIGEVPKHWQIRKLGNILSPVNEKNQPEMQLLSVVREKGVIIRDVNDMDSNHNFIPDDLSNYKVVRKGNFAMNKMKAWQGSYGVSLYDGIVSPAYYVFEINDIIPEYFHNAIRSKLYVAFFGKSSDGIRVGQWDLSKERMKEIPFLIPSVEEQIAIGKLIHEKNLEFDKYVCEIDKKIEKLKSLKQSLISEIVTGQIDVRDFEIPKEVE